MGLDISYYKSWKPYDGEVKDWDHAEEIQMAGTDLEHIYNGAGFEGRAKGIPEWVVTSGASGGFRAGSYGGYNRFRSLLCQALHGFPVGQLWAMSDNEQQEYDMWQMLHFSDCEGTLGTAVCKELHEAFERNWDKVMAFFTKEGDAEYYQVKLEEWRTAFKVAAGEGLIRFH